MGSALLGEVGPLAPFGRRSREPSARSGTPLCSMVEADTASVEARLCGGEISYMAYGGELRPWGWATVRTLRDHGRPVRLWPRPSRPTGAALSDLGQFSLQAS